MRSFGCRLLDRNFLRSVSRQTCLSATKKRLFSNHGSLSASGDSAVYLENLYQEWKKNIQSVSPFLQSYFADLDSSSVYGSVRPPSQGDESVTISGSKMLLPDVLKVEALIRAYRSSGHELTKLDPLGMHAQNLKKVSPELDISFYGWTEADLEKPIQLAPELIPFLIDAMPTLRTIIDALKRIYCGTIGIEYMHIGEPSIRDWIRDRFEKIEKYNNSAEQRQKILDRLLWADSFEKFLHVKYPGEKRFGLDGCEAFIPGLKALIDRSSDLGVTNMVLGMAHRGRLNVLSGVVKKPVESLFCEFNGFHDYSVGGSGDVKYHLGMNCEKITSSRKIVHISLAANPSHLEAVNPVVQGKVKALQTIQGDSTKERVLGLLIHGDAAFSGQGVVYESLGMSELPSYETGGMIHIVINNQIGFTTNPKSSRSTPYCTDISKIISAPVLHVNADDVEAVVFACTFAAEYRSAWKKDIVIDIVGYRRYGHNEFDEPSFTQPKMYQTIAKQKRVADQYSNLPFFDKSTTDALRASIWSSLESSFAKAKDYTPKATEWLASSWSGFKSPKELAEAYIPEPATGVSLDNLNFVGNCISGYPNGFTVHKGLAKILQARKHSIEQGTGIDMATAEGLAFGTLLLEGQHVRLSGQDVERGTFSQRHSVLHDQNTGNSYTPLGTLNPTIQGSFSVSNSHLSEFAVLGFELGYALASPRTLVMWEAQFGDFSNNAQCIIDQFLVSGEQKWHQRTGLVMILPHGYDGNGPEHSSARPERFLQQCDDSPSFFPPREQNRQHQDCNIQVVVPSSPATYFHILRRQLVREFRKPLIVFTSKALLRHPAARASLDELGPNTRLKKIIGDHQAEQSAGSIRKLIFCTGQVFYLLEKTRSEMKIKHVAMVRIEEISPFPYHEVQNQINLYGKKLESVMWVQEEPLNMGFWTYVEPRFETVLSHQDTKSKPALRVVSRAPSAAVSTGSKYTHVLEEEKLVEQAFQKN